jgi:prevent-host-death family protein
MDWQLAEAKNRFSEVVRLALSVGPQVVWRRDEAVVVLDKKKYDQLIGKRKTLVQFLLTESPSLEDLELGRDKSPMRDVEL